MPDDLLNLNLGQVQAVIDGYEERFTDSVCAAVWTGFYAGYYIRGKHTKKPKNTKIIRLCNYGSFFKSGGKGKGWY